MSCLAFLRFGRTMHVACIQNHHGQVQATFLDIIIYIYTYLDIQIISAHYRVLACFYWNEIDRDVCICEYIYIYMYTYGHVSSRGCPKSFNLGLFFLGFGHPSL